MPTPFHKPTDQPSTKGAGWELLAQGWFGVAAQLSKGDFQKAQALFLILLRHIYERSAESAEQLAKSTGGFRP